MPPTLHAVLGASSAHRWMLCPGSIAMSEGIPNESSVYAREGSAAHEICEMALRSGKNAAHYIDFVIPEYPEIKVDESMCACVQEYLDCVRAEIALYHEAGFNDWELGVEYKFNLTHIFPDMWGTCDAVLYLPAWKKLIVFDYKHGWVSVPVERNKQTMYYALGAITGKDNYDVEDVELVIVQPRTGRHAIIKRWACTRQDVLDFKVELVAAAEKTRLPNAPLNPGEWCKFCPAAPVCGAVHARVMALTAAEENIMYGYVMPEPKNLTPQQLQDVLINAGMVKSWIKNVEAYAKQQALTGNVPHGFKLAEGRANRKWKDADEAARYLKGLCFAGLIEGDIYASELKSPAQVEDMLPKKNRPVLEKYWNKGRGALVLVPEDDEKPHAKMSGDTEFEPEG